MTQLPSVAVVGAGRSFALALAALVDGGLDAQGVSSAALDPDARDVLSTHGLDGRLQRVDASVSVAGLGGEKSDHGQFGIVADGASLGSFDAVVVAGGMATYVHRVGGAAHTVDLEVCVAYSSRLRHMVDTKPLDHPGGTGQADVSGQPTSDGDGESFPTGVTPGTIGLARRFGGVFDPNSDGVYLVGAAGPAGGNHHRRARSGVTVKQGAVAVPDVAAVRELAWAQGSWVGEYLRGRYQLPARSVMLMHPGLPRRRCGWERHGVDGYLARLGRELQRGRARAAAAGYPLPLPSSAVPPSGVATYVRRAGRKSIT